MSWVDEFYVQVIALQQERDYWKNLAARIFNAYGCQEPDCTDCADMRLELGDAINADRGDS